MLVTNLECYKFKTFLNDNHLLRLELRCQKVEGERERWKANNDDDDDDDDYDDDDDDNDDNDDNESINSDD